MSDLNGLGFVVADVRLSNEQCDYIASSLPSMTAHRGGLRGLLFHPTILQLLRHEQLGHYLWSVTGRELVVVNAQLLEGALCSARAARWHQDRIIAVRDRMDVRGYGPWSTRVGIPHVEAPASVLGQMVVIRVHLDDPVTGSDSLRVLPGSHDGGKVRDDAIEGVVAAALPIAPAVAKGTLLLMRPLLLHASPMAPAGSNYRVLHIACAPAEAISPLQWQSSVNLRRAA